MDFPSILIAFRWIAAGLHAQVPRVPNAVIERSDRDSQAQLGRSKGVSTLRLGFHMVISYMYIYVYICIYILLYIYTCV